MGVERAELGECPVWDDATGSLLWIDITTGRILRHHLGGEGTADTEVAQFDQPVGAIAPCRGGGLLAALADGIAHRDPEGRIERLVDTSRSAPRHRFNDGTCDSRGRFFTGSTALEFGSEPGALYRLDPDGTFTVALDGLAFPNGIGFSPDERTLYLIDSLAWTLLAIPFNPASGGLGEPLRLIEFAEADGLPDGLAVDAEGCIWVARYGGGAIERYRPDGALARRIRLLVRQPTSLTFGGSRLDRLWVTSARQLLERPDDADGALLTLAAEVPGAPAHAFAL